MKHFDITQWADYIRGVATERDRAAMQQHLSAGCEKCSRLAGTLERFVAVIAADDTPEVPQHVHHLVRSIYALRQPERVTLARVVAKLVYDSFREPLPAGVRSQQRLSRQAMYEAGEYLVDLRLENEPGRSTVTLTGQVANRIQPAHMIADLPVSVLSGKQILVSTCSNAFGEFQLQYEPQRHLRLHLPIATTGKWIEVRLAELNHGQPEAEHLPPEADEGEKHSG